MDWSSHVGTFDNFVFDSPFPGLSFQAIYKDDQLDITATAMDGDANLDGVVNLLDLNALATNYGRTSQNWLGGDFTDANLSKWHIPARLPLWYPTSHNPRSCSLCSMPNAMWVAHSLPLS